MDISEPIYTPGQLATLACLYDVIAAKPGNVHRGADFEDVHFEDFAVSAVALGSVIDRLRQPSVGQLVFQCRDRNPIPGQKQYQLGPDSIDRTHGCRTRPSPTS